MRSRLLALPIAALAAVLFAGCTSTPGAPTSTEVPSAASDAPADEPDGACAYLPDDRPAVPGIELPDATPAEPASATLSTSAGDVAISFDAAAPCTVGSFASLAEQGYFDGTTCHRLTTQGIFVLQCGDPTATGTGGPGYSFADELSGSETYPAGTVAMANAGPDTNGSQFFLVYEDTQLAPSYTVFGHMDEAGIAAIAAVAADGTTDGAPDGTPATPVDIASVAID